MASLAEKTYRLKKKMPGSFLARWGSMLGVSILCIFAGSCTTVYIGIILGGMHTHPQTLFDMQYHIPGNRLHIHHGKAVESC